LHSLHHYQVRLQRSHRLRYRVARVLLAPLIPLLLILLILLIVALFYVAVTRS
jgi:hypothetical protein